MTPLTRTWTRLLGATSLTVLFAVPGVPALAGDNGNSNDKQTICHATNADGNAYVINTPDKNGDVSGHAADTGPVWNPDLKAAKIKWGDIIPPFDYNDHGTPAHFAGLNWDANGQAWFANGCTVPITATVDKTNDANGDATFSDDETATAAAAAVPFKVVVTNTSVVPAVLSSLTDAIGATPVTFACNPAVVGSTLAAGASATCLVTLAGYSPAHLASVVNTVTAVLHEVGNVENDGTASDDSTVRTFVANPDVSVVKTGPATAAPGDDLTWTLTVHNDGNVPLPGVTLTDSLPDGTSLVSATGSGWTCTGTAALSCSLTGELAVGGSSAVTVVATLSALFTGTSISNTALVTPDDATPDDNTSTVTTEVTQPGGGGGGGTGGGGGGGFTGGGGGPVTTGGSGLPRTGLPVAETFATGLAAVVIGSLLVGLTWRRAS